MHEDGKTVLLGQLIDGVEVFVIGIEMVVGGVEFDSSGSFFNRVFDLTVQVVFHRGIDCAEGEINVHALTEFQHILIGHNPCGKRTDFGEDHSLFNAETKKIVCEMPWIGQLIISLIEIRSGALLVFMNPWVPVFF